MDIMLKTREKENVVTFWDRTQDEKMAMLSVVIFEKELWGKGMENSIANNLDFS